MIIILYKTNDLKNFKVMNGKKLLFIIFSIIIPHYILSNHYYTILYYIINFDFIDLHFRLL